MNTRIVPVAADSLELAARLIRGGEVVAFGTETVYGLGADARNVSAVERVFRAKGRPMDNPLIVHLPSVAEIPSVCVCPADLLARLETVMPRRLR